MGKTNYLIDMDGVLIKGNTIIPGADAFIDRLRSKGHKFLLLTNNPLLTPQDLSHRLQRNGLSIGESGLMVALHEVGYILTDFEPDYVVLGETNSYNFEQVTRAVRLVNEGAHFIATNPDATGPTDHGIVPATGAMAALIEKATGRAPFFIGKPNPFMMRAALNHLGVHSEDTVMIGDRMDTDIVAGIQAGMGTILVLTGVTTREQINDYPYQPQRVFDSVAEVEI